MGKAIVVPQCIFPLFGHCFKTDGYALLDFIKQFHALSAQFFTALCEICNLFLSSQLFAYFLFSPEISPIGVSSVLCATTQYFCFLFFFSPDLTTCRYHGAGPV